MSVGDARAVTANQAARPSRFLRVRHGRLAEGGSATPFTGRGGCVGYAYFWAACPVDDHKPKERPRDCLPRPLFRVVRRLYQLTESTYTGPLHAPVVRNSTPIS